MSNLLELLLSPYEESYQQGLELVYSHTAKRANKYIKDPNIREDIVQDVVVKFWKTFELDENTTSRSIYEYLNLSLFTTYVDWLRKPENTTDVNPYKEMTDNTDIPSQLDMEALSSRIEAVLSEETERLQEVYHYIIKQGFSTKEAADRLGITDSTVRSLMQRLRRRIHDEIQI